LRKDHFSTGVWITCRHAWDTVHLYIQYAGAVPSNCPYKTSRRSLAYTTTPPPPARSPVRLGRRGAPAARLRHRGTKLPIQTLLFLIAAAETKCSVGKVISNERVRRQGGKFRWGGPLREMDDVRISPVAFVFRLSSRHFCSSFPGS